MNDNVLGGFNAVRNLGGAIQLDVRLKGGVLYGGRILLGMTEDEAIYLCNALRRALEAHALQKPEGENVVIMNLGGRQ